MGVHASSPEMNKAVQDAADNNVLIFASASTGHDTQIPYPARLHHVFCIFATDGNVRVSNFNPPPRPSTLNFAILGENVKLRQWKDPVSGTSVSTAIAAGLAAALLEFAHQPDARKVIGDEGLRNMGSMEGMAAVFKLMSTYHRDNGYDCLVPWDLLPSDVSKKKPETTRRVISENISMALRH